MLEKAGAAVVGALTKALMIVFLFIVLVGVVRWAQNHPAEWGSLIDKTITTAAAGLTWLLDQLGGLFA